MISISPWPRPLLEFDLSLSLISPWPWPLLDFDLSLTLISPWPWSLLDFNLSLPWYVLYLDLSLPWYLLYLDLSFPNVSVILILSQHITLLEILSSILSFVFWVFHFSSYLHFRRKTGKARDSLVDRRSILDEYPNLIKPEDLDFQTW